MLLSLLLALAVTVTMFRIGDPCCLLLVCLLAGLAWQRPCFRWWGIDGVLMCICLYDAVDFCLHPYRGIEAAEASLTGLCCYFLIRNASVESFLKLLLLPVGAALTLTFVSFGMFAEAVQGAGFTDTYPFRFLFRQGDSLVAFRFKSRPDGIGHHSRVALPVGHHLEFERQRDGVAILRTDGNLHEGRDLSGEQLFFHLLRQKVGLLLVDAQHRQLPVGQRFG